MIQLKYEFFFIADKPVVSVEHKMYTVLEGQHQTIECSVDANPPSEPIWKPSIYLF